MAQPSTITVPTQAFSASELLSLVEYRIAAILAGAQQYGENGRNVTHAVYRDLCEQRDKLKAEVEAAAASGTGGMNVLVQFGEAQ
jgi:hypothetical protein